MNADASYVVHKPEDGSKFLQSGESSGAWLEAGDAGLTRANFESLSMRNNVLRSSELHSGSYLSAFQMLHTRRSTFESCVSGETARGGVGFVGYSNPSERAGAGFLPVYI